MTNHPVAIPRKEEILKVTLPLIVESESWPHGKTFKHANQEATIVTFHHKGPKDRVAWYGRVRIPNQDILI